MVNIPEDIEIVDCDKLNFEWNEDKSGYFLIKIEDGLIKCGFVRDETMILELDGKDPSKIIKEIAKRRLVNLEHMGYIAKELTVAKYCLDNSKEYVQR